MFSYVEATTVELKETRRVAMKRPEWQKGTETQMGGVRGSVAAQQAKHRLQ